LLFARYAFPPNQLGYCGSPDHQSLLGYLSEGAVDQGLAELAQQFEGAYPWLRLIAETNGIGDPFDPRVVEAYWVGNGLLARVGASPLYESLRERFRPRMTGQDFSSLTAHLGDGVHPHHNYHVFEIYRRAGLLRDSRATIALDRMDQCRISWGTVVAVEGAEAVVQRAPLALAGGKITLGVPTAVRVQRHLPAAGALDDLQPGRVVSIHWSWACDILPPASQRALAGETRRVIEHTNKTL
ncbi:MAG TPA: DUF6390 family protein, partial [bacterium]|nr:DUF6390 family protein [bacterium]